jgi:gas vesicle protein
VGILLAPRSGEETRRLVREKADRLLNDILDAATLGTAATGDTTTTSRPAASATDVTDEAATTAKSGNGSRTRASKSTAASEAGV